MLVKRQDSLSQTNSPNQPADDRLLTAAEVGTLLGLTAAAVYQGKGAAAELTPIAFSKRCTRWSNNELQAMIKRRLADAQQASPAEQTNVFKLERRQSHQALTHAEIEEIIESVKVKR